LSEGIAMQNEAGFLVRISGRRENSYYIDNQGSYKIADIAGITGLDASYIKETYVSNNAVYDEGMDVYYFNLEDDAKKSISAITGKIRYQKGRAVFLTEAEIEYIRMALIKDSSYTIRTNTKMKDAIFRKLNF
jgi:hypothetical protein